MMNDQKNVNMMILNEKTMNVVLKNDKNIKKNQHEHYIRKKIRKSHSINQNKKR